MINIRNSTIYQILLGFYKSFLSVRRSKFGYIDKTAHVRYPIDILCPKNVYLYENAHIYSNATILAGRAKFIMKKNSGSAQGLTVITGNHYFKSGHFFMDISDSQKPSDLDKDVIVDEDVWLACNVTLLSGVHIGRGAVIGAGSVCRTSVPPYAIVFGNPAKVVGFRMSPEEIIEHECSLYSENERISHEILQKNYEKYFLNRIDIIKELLK